MAEYDGPGAYENAHPERDEPQEEHEFFRAGYEYHDGDGYTAPEVIRTFRCGWVGTHPGTQEPVAFGFMNSTVLGWGGTGMGPAHRKRDKWTCVGHWPRPGGGGVGGGRDRRTGAACVQRRQLHD